MLNSCYYFWLIKYKRPLRNPYPIDPGHSGQALLQKKVNSSSIPSRQMLKNLNLSRLPGVQRNMIEFCKDLYKKVGIIT